MKANAKTEAAVVTVLDTFLKAYQKRDIDGMMAVFAPDDDLMPFRLA